jgi:Co/Zn/Cd efflux system component
MLQRTPLEWRAASDGCCCFALRATLAAKTIRTRFAVMPSSCCDHCHDEHAAIRPAFRRALWIALAINLVMFGIEVAGGLGAGSVSLLADSLDFLGDAANYGVSLVVLGMALRWRARAALLKGASMGLFGLWVLFATAQHALAGTIPDAPAMGAISVIAVLANLAVAIVLYRYREGDSNMVSVWVCTRNDVIGNLAVLAAAVGVFGTHAGWPDFLVGAIMGALALSGAWRVMRQALAEVRLDTRPRVQAMARQ